MEGEIEYLIGEIQKLEEIKNNLEDVGQNAEDEEFLERVGRENFNLKKEGETTVAFPMIEEVIAATSSEIEVQVEEEKGSFWQRLENKLRK